MTTIDEFDLGIGEIVENSKGEIVQVLRREEDGGMMIQYIEAEDMLKNGSRQYIPKNYPGFTRIPKDNCLIKNN